MMPSLASLEPVMIVRGVILVGGLIALWFASQHARKAVAPIGAVLLAAMFGTTIIPASAFDFCKPKPRGDASWGTWSRPRPGSVPSKR